MIWGLRYKTSWPGLKSGAIVLGMNTRKVMSKMPESAGGMDQAGLLERVMLFYRKALKSAQKSRQWLKRQGLDNEGLQEQWELGAADGRLVKSLPTDGNGPVGHLRDLGILTPSGREYFHECITFPIRDGDNGIVSLAGVSFQGGDRILTTSPTALWNAPAIRLYPELILATSLLDALSLHLAGFPQTCGGGSPSQADGPLPAA
jgi:hypothetical protein